MRKTAPTIQDSWASTLSDYILQRRQQTKLAYSHNQWQHNRQNLANTAQYAQQASVLLPPNQDDWLFKIVFIALATQLEEGHTVLTLTSSNQPAGELAKSPLPDTARIITGTVDGQQGRLMDWQRPLIDSVATPLFAMIDDSVSENVIDSSSDAIFNQLNQLFIHGSQLWAPMTVTSHNNTMLIKRLEVVRQLYALLQSINRSDGAEPDQNSNSGNLSSINPNTTSFDRFIALINSNGLFSQFDSKNSLSNTKPQTSSNNNPIIYTISTNTASNHQQHHSITFWLHRPWQAEYNLTKTVHQILQAKIQPLPIHIPASLNKQQVAAIHVANHNAFSIITGGPGTGKTYTVAQLVIALQQAQHAETGAADTPVKFSSDGASLALAAPTGKAAQRMQESLQDALDAAKVDMQLQDAKTIHRLLGIGQNGRPRYHAGNPLGEDIIIVDEASMLGVELANHLVSAIKQGARLILLGDANQLAAVDAGAVLADLCHIPSLQPIHVTLSESRRFGADSGIGQLASFINQTDVDMAAIWRLLREDVDLAFHSVTANTNDLISVHQSDKGVKSPTENSLSNKKIINKLCDNYQNYLNQIQVIQKNTITKSKLDNRQNTTYDTNVDIDIDIPITINELLETFNQFRILTAGHHGDWGDHHLNDYISNWHKSELKLPIGKSPWFYGRPVMVLQNNYELGLFNGDIGICLETDRGLEVFFETKTQGIAVNLLNDDLIATAYAMTIHKSQGSEFNHVVITFDHTNARLLSKELIYTAVTRAKTKVTIYSTKWALQTAITTPTLRQTGLGLQFNSL